MAQRRRKPWISDRRTALVIGYVGIVVGSLALWDAYENRGANRPILIKFLPGP